MKDYHPKTLTDQILMFILLQDQWCTWGPSFYMPSVQQVFPVGAKEKHQMRFMKMLQKKGLVGGCDCGCRGDYVITEAGMDFLSGSCLSGEQKVKEYLKELQDKRE